MAFDYQAQSTKPEDPLAPVLIEPQAPTSTVNELPVKGPTPDPAGSDALGQWLADPLKALPHIRPDASPDTWLSLNSAWTGRKNSLNQERDQELLKIFDGTAQREIQTELDNVRQQIETIIGDMAAPLQLRPQALRYKIGDDIRQMEQELANGSYAKRINPQTGEYYTEKEYAEELKLTRKTAYVDAGLEPSQGETAGMLLAQLLDPANAREYYGIHRQLQDERLKIYQDETVKAWEQSQRIYTIKLQRLMNSETYLRELAAKDMDRQDTWRRAIWENSEANRRFEQQMQNGNWQFAVNQANDQLNTIKNLPPNQIEAALQVYNSNARLANSLKADNAPDLQVFSEEQVTAIVNEASRRQRDVAIEEVNKWVWQYRQKWENVTPADVQQLNSYLKTKGPYFNPATGKQEFLTIDDVALAVGFNRQTPKTQETIRSNKADETNAANKTKSQERIADKNNQTRQSIADKGNAARVQAATIRANASGKKPSDAEQKLLDKVNEEKLGLDRAEKALRDAGVNPAKPSLVQGIKYKAQISEYRRAKAAYEKAKDAYDARAKKGSTVNVPGLGGVSYRRG